jgi:hypothetical protein
MIDVPLVICSGISMGHAKEALKINVRVALLKDFLILVEKFRSLLLWPERANVLLSVRQRQPGMLQTEE